MIESEFGAAVNKSCPLAGHPNPYWRRDKYLNLNGQWDFQISKDKSLPGFYNEKITVPFAVESELSGIKRRVIKDDYLHYRRRVNLPDSFKNSSLLIHFMAVDQEADVYIDGELVGSHKGGYTPFTIYVAKPKNSFLLQVVVHDDTSSPIYARGKQVEKPNTIWYTPTSGIWQEVYLESIPKDGYVENCQIKADFDDRKLILDGFFKGIFDIREASLYLKGRLIGSSKFDESGHVEIDVKYDFYPWSIETPNIYELKIKYGDDIVHSLVAFRKIESKEVGGKRFLLINEKPTFLSALLDQGYWPESGLTPPSILAMEEDIKLAKKMGFNCLRKHIKVEPMRWYFLCDILGMYVIQDMINGGSKYSNFLIATAPLLPYKLKDHKAKIFGRGDPQSRVQFQEDMKNVVSSLSKVPSIVIWTLFNEGWGQFEAVKNTELLRSLDDTRLIDSTSGWYDQGCGDFNSKHIYFRKLRMKDDGKRLLSLSEYGGYSMKIKDHSWAKRNFGYKRYYEFEAFRYALDSLFNGQVACMIKKHNLSIAVYTQLSDVEEETNGVVTYDRKVIKADIKRLLKDNQNLYRLYQENYKKAK